VTFNKGKSSLNEVVISSGNRLFGKRPSLMIKMVLLKSMIDGQPKLYPFPAAETNASHKMMFESHQYPECGLSSVLQTDLTFCSEISIQHLHSAGTFIFTTDNRWGIQWIF